MVGWGGAGTSEVRAHTSSIGFFSTAPGMLSIGCKGKQAKYTEGGPPDFRSGRNAPGVGTVREGCGSDSRKWSLTVGKAAAGKRSGDYKTVGPALAADRSGWDGRIWHLEGEERARTPSSACLGPKEGGCTATGVGLVSSPTLERTTSKANAHTLGKGVLFNSGGGVDTALWLDPPPQKKAPLTGPQNPAGTDPWAPEVTGTQNSATKKNENRILESAHRGGSEKLSFAMYLMKKFFGTLGARVHNT